MNSHDDYLKQAIKLARDNIADGGRPFGAILVRDGVVVSEGVNTIHLSGDPTDHAELSAMRQAAKTLGTTRLEGCTVYASGQPCPMCLSAMYLTGVSHVFFAYGNQDGEAYNLSTASIYRELQKPIAEQQLDITHRPQQEPEPLYAQWHHHQGKVK